MKYKLNIGVEKVANKTCTPMSDVICPEYGKLELQR